MELKVNTFNGKLEKIHSFSNNRSEGHSALTLGD